MPQPLPRAYRRQLQALDTAKVARIVAEVGEDVEPPAVAGGTAAGDARRLRGVPCISRGTSGAIAGSDPLKALLQKERRRER